MEQQHGVSVGTGGWLAVERSDGVRWFVRVADRDGELQVDEVYARGAITAGGLTKLLKVVEVWLSLSDLVALVRERLGDPAPDLAGAMEWFGSTPHNVKLDVNGRAALWQEEMLVAQTLPPVDPDEEWRAIQQGRIVPRLPGEPYRGITRLQVETSFPAPVMRWLRGPLDLSVRTGEPYPPDFYERVADAYEQAVNDARIRGVRPTPTSDIADANGVPLSQAKRWVREAASEDRGFLKSAGQGRPMRRRRAD